MSDDDTIQMLEPVEGLGLEFPPEPLELRSSLRDSALGARDADAAYRSRFSAWMWERWRSGLEPAGMSRESFFEVVDGYRREFWLWLMGERRWEPLISGLAGRVSRRIPAG